MYGATREPDDSMIEVAISALKRVLSDEGVAEKTPIQASEVTNAEQAAPL